MSKERPKYRDENGKWGCLGCNYELYPNGGPDDYCANVRCLLRHPYAAGAEDVIRLVKRVGEIEAERDELAQGIENLIAVATTDVDGEGYVTAYHFKTGALHRLLGRSRQLSPGVLQNVAADFMAQREKDIAAHVEEIADKRERGELSGRIYK